MRKIFVAAATVAIFALLVTPAFAKPGGNGGGGGRGGGGGNQEVAVESSIELEDYSYLHLGYYVGFETNAVGLAGWEYPMVAVWCYQSGETVYMQLGQPDAEFLLGGGSDWQTNGGTADCVGKLYAYGSKNGQSIRELASVSFQAEG